MGQNTPAPASPDVVLLQGDDEDTTVGGEDAGHSEDEEALLQGMVSLLDISTSDNEEAIAKPLCARQCTRAMFSMVTGRNEQIHQGKEGIAQHDKGVNDYADGGRPSKAPGQDRAPIFLHGRAQGVQAPGHYSKPFGSL